MLEDVEEAAGVVLRVKVGHLDNRGHDLDIAENGQGLVPHSSLVLQGLGRGRVVLVLVQQGRVDVVGLQGRVYNVR